MSAGQATPNQLARLRALRRCAAELSRTGDKRGACGAACPASAPGLSLEGRPGGPQHPSMAYASRWPVHCVAVFLVAHCPARGRRIEGALRAAACDQICRP